MDDLDFKVLAALCRDARVTWSDLALHVGLSAPAAAERVRKLEERGVIRGYVPDIDAAALRLDVTAFVAVTLERPRHRDAFLKRIKRVAAVLECHHIAGEHDYLLKVRVPTLAALEAVVSRDIKGVEGVQSTRTTIALSTLKETLLPDLERSSAEESEP